MASTSSTAESRSSNRIDESALDDDYLYNFTGTLVLTILMLPAADIDDLDNIL
jgi:hypothetical protein